MRSFRPTAAKTGIFRPLSVDNGDCFFAAIFTCNITAQRKGGTPDVDRVFETAFGTGRRFAKYARTPWDYVIVTRSFVGDLVVDVLAFVAHPSRYSFLTTFARVSGFFHGLTSLGTAHS